jgi:hypothetical protein
MVDYNIAIPQQQLFQAPDFTQNAMRMQQTQLQEMQMQALARENAEARNIQRLYAQPGFDQFSPEGIKQLGQAGGYKAGIAAANAARQIENLQRQTDATNAGLKKTYLDIGAAQYDIAQNRLAAIPPGDAKSYAEWDRVHGSAFRANGVNIPTPEQWAQDPTGKLQAHMVSTSQTVRERAAKAPVYRDFAGTTLRVDPDNPDVLIEPSIRRAGASQQGAGTGPATAAMNPDRLAAMQATQARLGLPPMQPSAAGANAAVNNMPGASAAAAAAAPVVGNAMAAPPTTEAGGKIGLRAAPIGAGEFAQQQQAQIDQRALVQAEERTAAMERGKATEKEKTEAKARRETAGRVLQVLNDPEIDNLVKNSTSGALEYGLAAAKGAAFGTSTTGMENIGRLATIQEALLFRLANGKLGGGFTDKDSDTIRGMLGRVADPTTPANVRIKTLQDVRAMMNSVATGENMAIAPAAVEETKPSARRRTTLDGVGGGGQARGNAVVNGVDTSNPLLR